MVPETGIEPVTLSLEGFCSSTELPGLEKQAQRGYSERKRSQTKSIQKNSRVLFENLIVYVPITLYI